MAVKVIPNVALLLGLLSLEAHTQQRPVPVRNPDIPLQLAGVVVQPPPGTDWHFLERSSFDVLFVKQAKLPGHTRCARASVAKVREKIADPATFLAQTQARLEKGGDNPERYENVVVDIIKDDKWATYCLRYRVNALDTHSAQATGIPLRMLAAGRFCLHPITMSHVVHLSYWERGTGTQWTEGFDKEGEFLLGSLQFIDMTEQEREQEGKAPPPP